MSTQESFTCFQIMYDYHMRDYAMICVEKKLVCERQIRNKNPTHQLL